MKIQNITKLKSTLIFLGVFFFCLSSCNEKQQTTSSEGKLIENLTTNISKYPLEIIDLKKQLLIEGSSFLMGNDESEFDDEKPIREVKINAFYMDETPITYFDFDKYVTAGGTKSAYWNYNTYHISEQPVTGLNWYHAADFCNWRSEQEGLKPVYKFTEKLDAWGYPTCEFDSTANGYRLPTEAEFEYAARGHLEQKKFPWGNDFEDNFVNYDTEKGLMKGNWWRLAKVKTQKKNAFGLYGMSGNIWQWCNDWYSKNYYKTNENSNPKGIKKGSTKTMRGGSWGSPDAKYLQVSKRSFNAPSNYNYEIGFRCVRNLDASVLEKKAKKNKINKTHQFYKYTTSHYENPLKASFYSDVFVEKLGKFLADYYPNCLYFQQQIDEQEKLTPQEMAKLIVEVTKQYKVNPLFLTGIMVSESGFASCSFPRWYNNPMAYHWQNVLMPKGLPMYKPTKGRNRKYKNLQAGFARFCKGIRRKVYYRAARKTLDDFHLVYVGYRADEWMYTLSRVYKDVAGIQFEAKIPLQDAGNLIYSDWEVLK